MKTRAVSRTSSQHLLVILLAATVWLAAPQTGIAKSLYVVTKIVNFGLPIPVHAYDVGADGRLTFQASYDTPYEGAGTIGIAIDTESESLFITFEQSNRIQVLDARTMEPVRVTAAGGATDLAGIVYDHDKDLLYCVDRGTPNLYVYEWNPAEGSLRGVPGYPFKLEGAGAYGIALDEVDDQLYVASAGPEVRVYNTRDWSLARTIALRRVAIGVAVDPTRGYLYYGAGFAENFYLTQVHLETGSERDVQVAPDAGVMGLAVDPATGFVYVTTGRNAVPGGDDLLAFDVDLQLIDAVEDIGDPTGLTIPGKHTSYNPLNLTKQVNPPLTGDLVGDEIRHVRIGEELTYSICFDHGDKDLSGVALLDTLPPQVSFVSATGDGLYGRYDAATHTYLWENPPASPVGRTCLEIVVRVDAATVPGTAVTNIATLDTEQTPPTTTGVDVVATGVVFEPLNLGKIALQDGAETTPPVFARPGEDVTFKICFNNNNNDQAVTNVLLVDHLPAGLTLVRADGMDTFGSHDPFTRTVTWTFAELGPHHSACVELVARVDKEVPVGTTLFNMAVIDSDQTVRTTSGVDVIISLRPLQLSKTIVGGAVEDPDNPGVYLADPGEHITYAICCTNPSNDASIEGLTIVDTLPKQVRFVRADGEGDFAHYDPNEHAVTWRVESLEPKTQLCLELVVEVAPATEPGVVITNVATVTADEVASTTARVEVIVRESSVKAQLYLKPSQMVRTDTPTGTGIAAILHLPVGLGMEHIADAPIVLNPGHIRAASQMIYGTSSQGKVLAYFDGDAFMAATRGYGEFEVEVTGMLRSGRPFSGRGAIEIAKFGGP